jgi:transcriptional regulator with XRE-family HTH domain
MSFGSRKIHKAVAQEIRTQRLRVGLTRADLAGHLKCSPSQIAAIEQGRRRVDVDLLVKIARALRIDPVKFLGKMLG